MGLTLMENRMSSENLFSCLRELALDLRWSWNHSTDEIWGRLDPELWELTQNPWVVLQTVSKKSISDLARDAAFRGKVQQMLQSKKEREDASAWFQVAHPGSTLRQIAYFSMEFMLSEALPIYSGGLGNVAGDQLKAASDLGVPLLGIGLLYQQGYFRQEIDRNGLQRAVFPFNDPGQPSWMVGGRRRTRLIWAGRLAMDWNMETIPAGTHRKPILCTIAWRKK